MNPTTYVFLVLVAIIAANQVVLRVATLRRSPYAFWGLQAVNMVIACYILVWGLPGFEQYAIVSWILGLLLLFRMIQNNMIRTRYLRAAVREEHDAEKRARAKRMAEELRQQEAAPRPAPTAEPEATEPGATED